MLRLAILKSVGKNSHGQQIYRPIFESEDGEFLMELVSRVRHILGAKRHITIDDVCGAIATAFESYKRDFKGKTTKLP